MSNDNLFSIVDFGASKIRIVIYEKNFIKPKYISEYNNDLKVQVESSEKFSGDESIKKVILNIEDKLKQHIKNFDLMLDSSAYITFDLSLRSKLDKVEISTNIIKNIIQDAKSIVENNYKDFKILHLIILKYIIDGNEYVEFPNNLISNDLVIEIKFILLPIKIIDKIRYLFKLNHISLNNIYN